MLGFSVFFLLTLPWLNPFTYGPTPAVLPWLLSMVCIGTVIGLGATTTGARALGEAGQGWVRAVAGAWLAAALISATLGLIQYFGASATVAPWVSGTALGEAYGNLRQRNQFATLMAIGMAALTWWVRQSGAWRFASAAATLLALGCTASSSRTGLLQWVLFLVFVMLCGGSRQPAVRRILLSAGMAYVAGSVALPWLVGLDPMTTGALARLHGDGAACMGRPTLWSNVLYLIAQRPWFGWGWGELGFAHFVTLYPGARFCDILDNAHNLPLHLAVELGLPIATAVCSLGLWLVARAKPWRETVPTRQLAWSVLALIGLHSFLEYPLWYGPFQVAVGLSLWILWRTVRGGSTTDQEPQRHMPLTRMFAVSIATILIVCCAFAAWDYWRVSQLYLAPQDRAIGYQDSTMDKVKGSSLFRDQVEFAELTTEVLTPANAEHVHAMALRLLHFSPEPRVVEKLIESSVLLERNDEALFYLRRFEVAFPSEHAAWTARSTGDKTP